VLVAFMWFGVLGPLAVWTTAGELVAIPGLKVRALLADLLLHEGRPVPADRLIEDLWGEKPPRNPGGALSAKVSQLRRALEEAEPGGRKLVLSHPAGYLLQVDGEAVDAQRFTSLIAKARQTDDPRAMAALLADALALWRGPAFADFSDEPFTQAAIARLEEQRLTAREDQAEARLALGEHTQLGGELGDLLAEHPFRERLRAAHMRALYRAGRQSEALDSYQELRTYLAEELGLDPSPDLVALHRAILTQDPALDAPSGQRAPAARPPTNLPTPLTDLIGRDGAVAEVRAQLETDRLVTLVGPGGVGKTRLALETATRLVGSFTDGVWLVELAGLDRRGAQATIDSLIEVVMTVLDIQDTATPGAPVAPIDRLTGALGSQQLLLVLDNCEHLVEQVAELAELLLRAALGLRILATSREPLALAGEVVWQVPPLEVPDRAAGADLALLEQSSAVRLFVRRAAAAAGGFTLNADTAQPVAVLCRRLDGIPLALELAATRVRALGVHGLVARLDDRFRLLATGHRGAPPRQQTLMAMIDWSWELLTGPERAVLRRLAVHADGCTLEAAEVVCAADDLQAADVVELLARLVDRSLVVVVHGSDGPRYRLLESVAAYCVERLHQAGEVEQVRQRHQRYYSDLAEEAEPHLRGPDQRRWLRRLDAEAANLRSALDAAVERYPERGLRLACGLAWYWFVRGRLSEARRSLEAALAAADAAPAAVGAKAQAWHTGIELLQGDVADRAGRRDAALRLYDGLHDPLGRARAEWFLAFAVIDGGDLAAAEALLNRALATFRALGDRWGVAAALVTRARLAHVRSDLAALERDGEQSAKLFGELGDRWGQLQANGWLGALAEMTGDYERAGRLHRDGLRMAEELGLWPEVAFRLAWLGWIAMQLGDYAQAREWCEPAARLAVEQGYRPMQIFARMGLGFAARREGNFDLAETHLRSVLESIPQATRQGPALHLSLVLVELGFIAEQHGDAAAALALHLNAFALADKLDAPRDKTVALEGLAGALTLAGRHGYAAQLLGAAATARNSMALPLAPAERGDIDRATARARQALGDDGFGAAFERGGKLTPNEARSVVIRAGLPDSLGGSETTSYPTVAFDRSWAHEA
jgi:predicted ATPase/DNA-binding SARP family transcriptional activator